MFRLRIELLGTNLCQFYGYPAPAFSNFPALGRCDKLSTFSNGSPYTFHIFLSVYSSTNLLWQQHRQTRIFPFQKFYLTNNTKPSKKLAPHYHGQFALPLGKESPYIFSKFNRFNTDTPLIRRLSIALLTMFDYTQFSSLSPISFAQLWWSLNFQQGPVPRKMIKFNPGLRQILSKVFLSKNMQFEFAKYCWAINPRNSNDNTKYNSKQYTGR